MNNDTPPSTYGWSTSDYLKYNMPAIEAAIRKEKIQVYLSCNEWGAPLHLESPDFGSRLFRPAPKPVVELWTFDTAPRAGWIRFKVNPTCIHLIDSINTNGLNFAPNGFNCYKDLLEYAEWSVNGRTDWIPCGYVTQS